MCVCVCVPLCACLSACPCTSTLTFRASQGLSLGASSLASVFSVCWFCLFVCFFYAAESIAGEADFAPPPSPVPPRPIKKRAPDRDKHIDSLITSPFRTVRPPFVAPSSIGSPLIFFLTEMNQDHVIALFVCFFLCPPPPPPAPISLPCPMLLQRWCLHFLDFSSFLFGSPSISIPSPTFSWSNFINRFVVVDSLQK